MTTPHHEPNPRQEDGLTPPPVPVTSQSSPRLSELIVQLRTLAVALQITGPSGADISVDPAIKEIFSGLKTSVDLAQAEHSELARQQGLKRTKELLPHLYAVVSTSLDYPFDPDCKHLKKIAKYPGRAAFKLSPLPDYSEVATDLAKLTDKAFCSWPDFSRASLALPEATNESPAVPAKIVSIIEYIAEVSAAKHREDDSFTKCRQLLEIIRQLIDAEVSIDSLSLQLAKSMLASTQEITQEMKYRSFDSTSAFFSAAGKYPEIGGAALRTCNGLDSLIPALLYTYWTSASKEKAKRAAIDPEDWIFDARDVAQPLKLWAASLEPASRQRLANSEIPGLSNLIEAVAHIDGFSLWADIRQDLREKLVQQHMKDLLGHALLSNKNAVDQLAASTLETLPPPYGPPILRAAAAIFSSTDSPRGSALTNRLIDIFLSVEHLSADHSLRIHEDRALAKALSCVVLKNIGEPQAARAISFVAAQAAKDPSLYPDLKRMVRESGRAGLWGVNDYAFTNSFSARQAGKFFLNSDIPSTHGFPEYIAWASSENSSADPSLAFSRGAISITRNYPHLCEQLKSTLRSLSDGSKNHGDFGITLLDPRSDTGKLVQLLGGERQHDLERGVPLRHKIKTVASGLGLQRGNLSALPARFLGSDPHNPLGLFFSYLCEAPRPLPSRGIYQYIKRTQAVCGDIPDEIIDAITMWVPLISANGAVHSAFGGVEPRQMIKDVIAHAFPQEEAPKNPGVFIDLDRETTLTPGDFTRVLLAKYLAESKGNDISIERSIAIRQLLFDSVRYDTTKLNLGEKANSAFREFICELLPKKIESSGETSPILSQHAFPLTPLIAAPIDIEESKRFLSILTSPQADSKQAYGISAQELTEWLLPLHLREPVFRAVQRLTVGNEIEPQSLLNDFAAGTSPKADFLAEILAVCKSSENLYSPEERNEFTQVFVNDRTPLEPSVRAVFLRRMSEPQIDSDLSLAEIYRDVLSEFRKPKVTDHHPILSRNWIWNTLFDGDILRSELHAVGIPLTENMPPELQFQYQRAAGISVLSVEHLATIPVGLTELTNVPLNVKQRPKNRKTSDAPQMEKGIVDGLIRVVQEFSHVSKDEAIAAPRPRALAEAFVRYLRTSDPTNYPVSPDAPELAVLVETIARYIYNAAPHESGLPPDLAQMHTVKTPWDKVTAVDLLHALTVPMVFDKIAYHQRNPLVAAGIYPDADRVDACEYLFDSVKKDIGFKMLLQALSPEAQTILTGAFTLRRRGDVKPEQPPGPSGKTISITLLPTRGPAMEFFGYFSETCISSEHFLPVMFPKVSAIYFVKKDSPATNNDTTAHEPWRGTPWGGTLLAITETHTGERAAVLYAFNPSSKALKEVDSGSLFEEVKSAIISRMEALDVRYLLIPKDDYPQFALTNRPAVFAYLKENYLEKGLPLMQLRQSADTAVVDLSISERTIVIHDRVPQSFGKTTPAS